jgi:hypothetical protein
LAYQSASCGREKKRISRELGDHAQLVLKEHTTHDFEWGVVKTMPFPLTKREFLARYLSFKQPNGDLVLAFDALPSSTKVDYGANLKVVRAKTTGFVRFKPINDDTQCDVILIQHGDAGGFVPERVAVAKIPQALRGVADMRELFQRDDSIDDAARGELAAVINDRPQVYTDEELDILDFMTDTLGMLKEEKFKKLDSLDHLVNMHSIIKEEDSSVVGRASTVRRASEASV